MHKILPKMRIINSIGIGIGVKVGGHKMNGENGDIDKVGMIKEKMVGMIHMKMIQIKIFHGMNFYQKKS